MPLYDLSLKCKFQMNRKIMERGGNQCMELLQNTSMKKVQIYLECDQWRNIFYSLKRLE